MNHAWGAVPMLRYRPRLVGPGIARDVCPGVRRLWPPRDFNCARRPCRGRIESAFDGGAGRAAVPLPGRRRRGAARQGAAAGGRERPAQGTGRRPAPPSARWPADARTAVAAERGRRPPVAGEPKRQAPPLQPRLVVEETLGLGLADPQPPQPRLFVVGDRVRLPSADAGQPPPLPILAQPTADRAPLDDPTVEASASAATAATMPQRTNPVPYFRVTLPDPFANRQPLRLPLPPDDAGPRVRDGPPTDAVRAVPSRRWARTRPAVAAYDFVRAEHRRPWPLLRGS